uniref:RING-type E3 ubiquitin transferase n=2 Tax=Meloidogyne TaxID=189290 RepID=A0A914KRB3_MELIC
MGTTNDNDGSGDMDICRVCRLTGNDALYHPCLCTGSIKYIHQDCLLQWLKYSKKDVCELCNHKFSFRPLYRADMPERLPLRDLLRGIFMIVARFLRLGFTYTLVLTCWLGLVPLMAARTHRLVFSGFISSIFLKRAVRCWCRIVGGWLQLDSYLLPSEKDKNNVDQRENQRQRARQRLMRGDQNEQLGLLEVLEAIEDDTTDDEPADENENDHVENDTNNAQNNDKEACENFSQVADSSKAGESSSAAPFDTDIKNNAAHAEPQQNIPNNVMLDEGMQQQNEQGEHRQARQRVQEQREQRNLGAQHHALLHFRDTALTVEYVRPNLFPLRIVLLLICFAITAILLALSAFLIPVTIGRTLFKTLSSQIHDLYSIATGVYICWILTRLISMTKEWLLHFRDTALTVEYVRPNLSLF